MINVALFALATKRKWANPARKRMCQHFTFNSAFHHSKRSQRVALPLKNSSVGNLLIFLILATPRTLHINVLIARGVAWCIWTSLPSQFMLGRLSASASAAAGRPQFRARADSKSRRFVTGESKELPLLLLAEDEKTENAYSRITLGSRLCSILHLNPRAAKRV